MKRIIKILLGISLCITLVACGGGSKKSAKEFDAFVDKLPSKMLSDTDYELNYLFADKEAAGYKDETYEFPSPSRKTYDQSIEEIDAIYDELETYDRDSLSKEQQLTYDVMMDAFDTSSEVSEDANYYLSTNYLDNVYGEPSNLPMNLYFYVFREESDVTSYLNLLKTSPDYFKKLVKHEQERQDEGYGMTPAQVKSVKETCEEFVSGDKQYLIDTFNQKIDALEGVGDEQKVVYRTNNQAYVEEYLTKAYRDLGTALDKLDVKTKKDEGYASVYDDGDTYYEELIAEDTGFEDIEDYRDYIEHKKDEYLSEFVISLQSLDETKQNELMNMKIPYTTATSPQVALEELEVDMKADFPSIREVGYTMEIVPPSMQSIFEAAAAYFISPVDDVNSKERMVLNGDYSQDNFLTIAHEGFPGHMYQTQYFKEQDQPILRQLMDYSGYTEGYANYVEQYSAKYASDIEMAETWTDYQRYLYAEILLLDLKIHYDGESEKSIKNDIVALYGEMSEEDVASVYEQLLFTPALFAKYYAAGYRLEDLKEEVKDEMGNDYSDMEFHKALLDVGPAPYDIVEQYVMEAVK